MARHVAGYADEWARVLADPDKLARFVSFVNAPDQPDPTVVFDDSGPRKAPVLLEPCRRRLNATEACGNRAETCARHSRHRRLGP